MHCRRVGVGVAVIIQGGLDLGWGAALPPCRATLRGRDRLSGQAPSHSPGGEGVAIISPQLLVVNN